MSNIYKEIAQATIEASSLISSGYTSTDAVEKVARDFGLNNHKIDRVVEAVNTAQQLSVIRSDNRRSEFSVASPDIVKNRLMGTSEKKASLSCAIPEYTIGKDYYAESLEDKYLPTYTVKPLEITPTTTCDDIVSKINSLEKSADSLLHKYAAIHHDFLEELSFLPSERSNLKEYLSNAFHLHKGHPFAEKTADFIWKAKAKESFTPLEEESLLENVEKYASFKTLCDCMRGMDLLSKKTQTLDGTAKMARHTLTKLLDMGNPVRTSESGFLIESTMKKTASYNKALEEKTAGLGSLLLPAIGGAFSAATKKHEKILDVDPGWKTAKKFLKSIEGASLLKDVMKNDEVIKEFPKKDVVNAFNSLRNVSERSALNRDILVAWIRRSLTHPDSITAEDFAPFRKHEREMLEAEFIEKKKGVPLPQPKSN